MTSMPDLQAVRLTDAMRGPGGKGALAAITQEAASAGRGGDSFLVHVNGKELEEMKARWGEPTINPETGMPEFFLGGLRDWFKDNSWASFALPVATSMFLPGIGSTVGGGINDALGLGLSSTGSQALGGALTNGALGFLTGGGRGALIGAGVGAAMPYLTGSGGPLSGIFGGSGDYSALGGQDSPGDAAKGGGYSSSPASTSGSSGGALSGLFGGNGSTIQKALPLLAVAGALGGGGGSKSTPTVSNDQQQALDSQKKHLSQISFDRQYVGPKGDLTKYGYGPEQNMYRNNRVPQYAWGGAVNDNPGGSPLSFMQKLFLQRGTGQVDAAKDLRSNPARRLPYQDQPPNQNNRIHIRPMPGSYAGGGSVGPYNDGAPDRSDGYYIAPPMIGAYVKGADKRVRKQVIQRPQLPMMGEFVRPANEKAKGGALQMASQGHSNYIRGPGTGRDDSIPAMLSDGEYVMDAETVSLLGNGSSEAGGKVLDEFRKNLRQQKGKALAKGKFSPDAKNPLAYLPKKGK